MTKNSRKVKSWIKGFVSLTEGTAAPVIFRKWAAISIIAGALERKIWARYRKRDLYPNLYVLLTAGPGVGKTDAIRGVTSFLRRLPEVHIAPSSVSRASLADVLMESTRTIVRPGEAQAVTTFNSLSVCADELGTFLATYEGEFMSTLNKLYDCILYDERKRHMKKGEAIMIPDPQLNLIAGTTPGWLMTNLPQQAWSEGFASRLLMVYSPVLAPRDPWVDEERDMRLEADLDSDLLEIHNMFGLMRFTVEVRDAFRSWYMGGQHPLPDHPKLEHYLPRRPVHLLKIAMCISAQRGNDYTITMEDYNEAWKMLVEIEGLMPTVFREMRSGGDSAIFDETYNEVERLFVAEQKPVAEHKITRFISQRVPAYAIRKILEALLDTNMLRIANAVGPGGRPLYAPVPRNHHNSS